MIPLSIPNISGNELKYVKECLETGWISTAGDFVTRFENDFSDFVKSNGAVSVVNGTSALHLALQALGVKSGEKVVIPNITFVASANAISYMGAEPILVDINEETWQMDLNILEDFLEKDCKNIDGDIVEASSNKRVAAIMIVHVQGNICNMDELLRISKKFNLPILEDAAEALGSKYRESYAGTMGEIGCYSFNGNKIISTGGGGMIIAKDKKLLNKIRHLATTAKTDPLRYFHDEVGYNYRLVNVLSAIGVAQLEQLDAFIKRKNEISLFYRENLQNTGDIGFQKISDDVYSNEWLFTILTNQMEELLKFLNKNMIMSRPFWVPMNKLPMYSNCSYISSNSISERVHLRALSIPCSTNISQPELEEVIKKIKDFYKT